MSDETRATDRPATFRDVFASREYRFVYSSATLSWTGDYLAKAAVTALVFTETKSVALSATAFAISFLPWLLGGPLLAAMAERRRYRSVMVACDLLRAGLMVLVAIEGIPVWAMLVLLFAASLVNPPFQAARSALMPQILPGDRYVVGLSLQTSTAQAAQLMGYLIGAALAPFYPRFALLLNAATFAASALLIRIGVSDRGPIGVPPKREHLIREAADGFHVVFGSRVLRAIAAVTFSAMLFAIVPEGLAAAWAGEFATDNANDRGWIQGVLMMASPVGFIAGGLVVGRLVRPERRRRLIRVFAVLAPLALVPALGDPPAWAIVVLGALCGFSVAGMMPAANGLFVQALPAGYRARAFGVMQGGVQIAQGVAVLATGALAERFAIPTVVGAWSLAGAAVLLLVVLRWPSKEAIDRAVATAQAANGRHTAPDDPPTPPAGIPSPGRHRAGGPVEAASV